MHIVTFTLPSRNATISQRKNGEMAFIFRIGYRRSSHLLRAQVRAHFVVMEEGENYYKHQELIVR